MRSSISSPQGSRSRRTRAAGSRNRGNGSRPAAGELVKGGGHLGGQRRVPEIVRHVDHAELDPSGGAGERREDRPPFEDRLVLAEHQVIGNPERVVAQLLGALPPGQNHGGIELGQTRGAKELDPGAGEDRQTDAKLDVTHVETSPRVAAPILDKARSAVMCHSEPGRGISLFPACTAM